MPLFYLMWSTAFATPPAHASAWTEIYTKDDVAVSKMELEGTKFFAFKGETVYDAPATKVMHVLLDNDHRTDWVDMLYEATELEKNGPFDYILYQAFDLPLTFADRDYVYRGEAIRISDTVVELHIASVEHDSKPAEETVGVRAELVNTLYRLTDEADGKTRVEVEVQTDPKGWMPIWLVNLVQKDWPRETLVGLRNELSKPYTDHYPLPDADGQPMPLPGEEPAEEAAAEGEAAEATEGEAAEATEGEAAEATEGEAAEATEAAE
ncbi:MAG: hypothetical protein ACI8PZ_006678 [Myxococcota bacterium]|jgi:hypothetical protein